jgi:hypothetical protein
MRSHAVDHFHMTTGGIDDESKVHTVYLGPSLSRLCASGHTEIVF